jgi:hypothetical protein
MAIRAYEFALCDLVQDCALAVAARQQRADVVDLARPGQVIPRHRRVMEDAATVGTRLASLQIDVPIAKFTVTLLLLR